MTKTKRSTKPETITFGELDGQKEVQSRTFHLLIKPSLSDTVASLTEAVKVAERHDATVNEPPTAPAAQKKLDALREAVEQHTWPFTMQAVPRRRYEELLEEHSPREPEDEYPNDHELGYNPDSFPLHMIAESSVAVVCDHCNRESVKLTVKDVERIWDTWSNGECARLWVEAQLVNQQIRTAGFTNAGTAKTNGSG